MLLLKLQCPPGSVPASFVAHPTAWSSVHHPCLFPLLPFLWALAFHLQLTLTCLHGHQGQQEAGKPRNLCLGIVWLGRGEAWAWPVWSKQICHYSFFPGEPEAFLSVCAIQISIGSAWGCCLRGQKSTLYCPVGSSEPCHSPATALMGSSAQI